MSDVQPMLYIENLERGIAFYRDGLGFEVIVFGRHKESGAPLIAGAKLEDAFFLLTNEPLFRGDGEMGGSVRLYFHLQTPVDTLAERFAKVEEAEIIQGPTDQHWGDRTVIVRDPWGVLLVFSNGVQQ